MSMNIQYSSIKRGLFMDVSLYCCYSVGLRDFLKSNGVRYKLVAQNPNSNNIFWVYVRNQKLDNLLSKWSAR